IVDRPDAPQAVIAALRPGVGASDPEEPAPWRVNDAIGGSVPSRLKQDMLADLKKFADGGLTDGEVERTRSQARGELVSVYQSDEGIAGHLAADASLGLPPDWEAKSRAKREGAMNPELAALAKQFFDPSDAILVVVGPRARVQPMIDKLGLPPAEIRDADGNVSK